MFGLRFFDLCNILYVFTMGFMFINMIVELVMLFHSLFDGVGMGWGWGVPSQAGPLTMM